MKILATEHDVVTRSDPYRWPAALRALRILRHMEFRSVAPSSIFADEPSDKVAHFTTLDAEHAFVRVPMRQDVQGAVPEDVAVDDGNLLVHLRTQIDDDTDAPQ